MSPGFGISLTDVFWSATVLSFTTLLNVRRVVSFVSSAAHSDVDELEPVRATGHDHTLNAALLAFGGHFCLQFLLTASLGVGHSASLMLIPIIQGSCAEWSISYKFFDLPLALPLPLPLFCQLAGGPV